MACTASQGFTVRLAERHLVAREGQAPAAVAHGLPRTCNILKAFRELSVSEGEDFRGGTFPVHDTEKNDRQWNMRGIS